ARGPGHGIAAIRHRRRAGVGILARHDHVIPALALRRGDDADRLLLGLEDRPLLDMRLEKGANLAPADGQLSGIADLLERLPHRDTIGVLEAEREVERKLACEDAGGGHRRREPRAFFVRPNDRLDWGPRLDSEVIQGPQHLKTRHDAIGAIELAAGRLTVEMAACHDRRQRVVGAGTARENIADRVDADRATRLLAPVPEKIARLLVECRQREPAHPTLGRGTDLRHLHEALPQPFAIDLEILLHPRPPELAGGNRRRWRVAGQGSLGIARPMSAVKSSPAGSVPNVRPWSPPSREAQNASATSAGPWRRRREASKAKASASTNRRARTSISPRSANSMPRRARKRSKRPSIPRAAFNSVKTRSALSGSRSNVRNTSRQMMLPEPSQMP